MATHAEGNPRYSVRPFSGKQYTKNSRKCGDDETPCAICGRGVKDPWPHTAIVIDGGGSWGDEKSDESDPGYMGCWPVGSDCHRRHFQHPTARFSAETRPQENS